ncbi:DUF1573 domain-containing protein [Niabella ginsengisoli]|uniref:DUF1573 domain-containing protein n=1 Tax=Niabella ginsengisoli TaxID=522298 RepID=A0ABS9SHE3_9BACT|nr:DUF1573 domain-containing protein [Niabella ginsengisoli]MCH5597745.1 DUF1573 domain-containing protein [Niabella ginsengisoli]
MKRLVLIISVAASLAACNSSDSNSENKIPDGPLTDSLKQVALKDSSNFTTIAWADSTFKDLGDVKKGQVVEIPFVVKNTGDKPLIISSVQPGCGCTVAEKPEQPILPGKEEKIVAKFNSEGQSEGSHTKTVIVTGNTKPFTQHTLSFKVNVTK